MKLHKLTKGEAQGYTTWGCMWERGKCTNDTVYICHAQNGEKVPMQSRVTAYWPDGSIKWTAHTADSRRLGEGMEILAGEGSAPEYTEICAEQEGKLNITETARVIQIDAGELKLSVPREGAYLFERVSFKGNVRALHARAVLILEEPVIIQGRTARMEKQYQGYIRSAELEEQGKLAAIVKFTGVHRDECGEERFPFIIRMKIGYGDVSLNMIHTFLYDGDEDKDYLKGMGIAFTMPMSGAVYNRHIKVTGDHGVFHEVVVPLISGRPRIPSELYKRQMDGQMVELSMEEKAIVNQVLENTPYWSEYDVCQDSVNHFGIRKKLSPDNCCYIDCLHGNRTNGGFSFGSESGSVLLGIRDFWEKYPSGYTVRGLEEDCAECTLWFWSPTAPVMDFRHYANRGYSLVCYEGYDYKGAAPDGIACTNECTIGFAEELIPEDCALEAFADRQNHPVQYVGTPEFYHEMRAFGYWSLPFVNTETEVWLEKQMEKIFEFYRDEVKQRNWYGMFNYGDFMHTYDPIRHQWKYDMGGFAWDNTELVPTLWLWLYFIRTGREDVFELAAKLSRHASEVDVYHMGPYKGLGSRHNVRHWGCPCKEARIAMAAHHRMYYYMTGDRRLEDIFEELKDNEESFLNRDPLGDFYDKKDMVYPSHARSGPDWSSLCSNWMTRWERFGDSAYRKKIETGINDIKRAPLKLVSGPDFEFDPATCHLRYIGERATGGTHLQICMGAPQIWFELADLLEDEEWKRMLAEYGRFYYLPRKEQQEESGGLIGEREFSLPFMAAAMGAYGAKYLRDEDLALRTWRILLNTLMYGQDHSGFLQVELENQGNSSCLREIPWISTNFVAQFCLNVIMALDFIREQLPNTLEGVDMLLAENTDASYYHKA